MRFDIVSVKTKGDIILYGGVSEAVHPQTVLINIHGTAGNFYEEEFINLLAECLLEQGISVLSTNNRGNAVLQAYPAQHGAAAELFEDCVFDIDAWIDFALSKGYQKIILSGHSLGTEKVVYYMNKGKYRDIIKAVILFGFSDSCGAQYRCFKRSTLKKMMHEAKDLIKKGKGNVCLTTEWFSHSGALPKTASAYVNFFEKNSELSKTFPLRQGKNLDFYQKIPVPILALIGDQKEYTVIPIKSALILLKKENHRTEAVQLKNCNHDFEGKEKEVVRIVGKFLSRIHL